MKRRMKTIKELDVIIQDIVNNNFKLYELITKESDKEIKDFLLPISQAYTAVNLEVSLYILKNIVIYYNKDLVDVDFENITKNLEQEFKDKKPKKENNGTQDKS